MRINFLQSFTPNSHTISTYQGRADTDTGNTALKCGKWHSPFTVYITLPSLP